MSKTILTQIIDNIADARGVDPVELDISIERYVSTDAIQDLIKHRSNSWRIQFETPDHVIEVTGNDEIIVDGTQIETVS